MNKKYLVKHFPIDNKYNFGEKKHLRHFFQIISQPYSVQIDKNSVAED